MAEVTTTCVKCDFCPAQAAAEARNEKGFCKVGRFDLCPKCSASVSAALSGGISAAFIRKCLVLLACTGR